jgi:hypothetical protein
MNRTLKYSLVVLSVSLLASGCTTPIQAELDAEVRRLCAQDGGVRVYETVKLPSDRFDQFGKIRIPLKADAKPADEYYIDWSVHYYRRGNPEVSRDDFKIIRRSDGKTLGQAIYYGRGGGDRTGPWHESSFKCPDPTKQPSLESSVFVRGQQ